MVYDEIPAIFNPYQIVKDIWTDAEIKYKDKKVQEFVTVRNFILNHRVYLSNLAGQYYTSKGYKILHPKIPLLIKKEWILPSPIEIDKIQLIMDEEKSEGVISKTVPPLNMSYAEAVKEFFPKTKLDDDPTYTLLKVESIKDNYRIICGLSSYHKYFNTCELLGYEFARNFTKKVKEEELENFTKKEIHKIKFKFRDEIDVFDFSNRSTCIGINTMLIGISEREESVFFLHERGKKKDDENKERIAEAVGTQHVVPAGTFQQWKRGDTYTKRDFDMYHNIMKEFGEELLGQKEFQKMSRGLNSIFDFDIIKKYDRLIKEKLGKIYYLGMGLDCFTTKPEFLTVMIYKKDAVDDLIGGFNFHSNFEGEHYDTSFTYENVKKWSEDPTMLPAGAACLKIVADNFSFFENCFTE